MSIEAKASIQVRYHETDQMGVVHHSNYIHWFEVGRTQLIKQLGYTYREVEENGLLLPVIDMTCQYKKPAKYDDIIEVRTTIAEYSGVRLTFAYAIYRGDECLVTGTTSHCWTTTSLRPVHLKKSWPHLHKLIKEAAHQRGAKNV